MRQVVQYLRRLAGGVAEAGSDVQLLREYVATRAEEPFATLVRRHGAMVLRVCRRVLGEGEDADDAFQATFLVLARKAGAGGWRESVGAWLAAVAYRIARKSRVARARRAVHEQEAASRRRATSEENPALREVQHILDEELDRLPEKFRLPVLLCCLQDQTTDEAARQLGWSFATVKSRLQRGRERLRERLRRRGVTLPAAVLATILAEGVVKGVPPALVQTTVTAAVSGTSSAAVSALVTAAIATMFWNKVKKAVLVLAAVGLVGLGAGLWSFRTPPEMNAVPVPENPPLADKPPAGPVIVVAASYPGAIAQEVAAQVAAPIEKQLKGVEGMVRIKSTSDNDGKYAAHLYFAPKTDLKSAMKTVEMRVWRAEPMLAPAVLRNKVSVKIEKAEAGLNQVDIAVIDRGDNGWEALQKAASVVVKRLTAAGALTKPQVFPRDEKLIYFDVDPAKCKSLGVPLNDVYKALEAAGSTLKLKRFQIGSGPDLFGKAAVADQHPGVMGHLKKVVVRDKVTLADVVAIKAVLVPAAVYHVDLYPAIRITAAPPEGKSVAAAGAHCVDLAEAEMNRLNSRDSADFAVKNLSAK
jgi:RNA polymerase sigma-70 factor (ECF subfamily)